MIISTRTKISLAQLLHLYDIQFIESLCEKHSLGNCNKDLNTIRDALEYECLSELIEEIVSTKDSLRHMISPRYTFDERWDDFKKCLLLDGYLIEDKLIKKIEPTIDGVITLENDLESELLKSALSQKTEIIQCLSDSANAFKKVSPDYNGCLSKARLTLETMVRNKVEDETGRNEKWGKALDKLKNMDILTKNEEQAIAKTYTLVSDGSHIPLGFTDEEYARYGRNLLMSTCYYLIKKINASSKKTLDWL